MCVVSPRRSWIRVWCKTSSLDSYGEPCCKLVRQFGKAKSMKAKASSEHFNF